MNKPIPTAVHRYVRLPVPIIVCRYRYIPPRSASLLLSPRHPTTAMINHVPIAVHRYVRLPIPIIVCWYRHILCDPPQPTAVIPPIATTDE